MQNTPQRFQSSCHEKIAKVLFTLIVSGLAVWFLMLVVTAQSARDTMQGRVADAGGAVLPGASVIAQMLKIEIQIHAERFLEWLGEKLLESGARAVTGAEKWRQRIGSECWTSPLAAGDRIYFFTNEGETLVMKAGAQYEELAKNTLPTERICGVALVVAA